MEKRTSEWYYAVGNWTDKELLEDYCELLQMNNKGIELCTYLLSASSDDKKDFLQAYRVMMLKLRAGGIERLNGGNMYGQY